MGWRTAGDVAGAFLHTPPFPLLLSAVTPPAAAGLALTLAGRTLAGRTLAGVNADSAVAEAFAGSWRDATGGGVPASIACVTRQVAGMVRVGPGLHAAGTAEPRVR